VAITIQITENCVSTCKFRDNQSNCSSGIAIHLFSKWRLSAILIFKSKFYWPVGLSGLICVVTPNFMAIGQTVAEMWRFLTFMMAAVRHLGILKIRIFDRWVKMPNLIASLCQISSQSTEPLPIYDNFSLSICRPKAGICYDQHTHQI